MAVPYASDEPDERQIEIYRRMSPEERWRVARRWYWQMRDLKAAYLRSEHPEWTEEQVQQAVKEAFLYART